MQFRTTLTIVTMAGIPNIEHNILNYGIAETIAINLTIFGEFRAI